MAVVSADRIDEYMTSSETHRIFKAALFAAVLPLCVAFGVVVQAQEAVYPDSTSAGSASMDSLEARMSRSKWTRWLNDYIFLGAVQSDSAETMLVTDVASETLYVPYRGRFIRNIDVARLPVFNTESPVPSGVLGIGNAIHIDTQERIIRKYFLMKKGTPLDPYLLADTERILRSTSFIQDATIVVIPLAESADSVDLLVVTQDLWSLGVSGSVRSKDQYKVRLFDRNFLGIGHGIEAEFDVNRERSQQVNLAGLYRIDNILGSFVDCELRYLDSHVENRSQVILSRPFRAVEIKYGGALNVSRVEEKDASAEVATSYDSQDFWVGRAFRVGKARFDGEKRAQFTVSGRVAAKDFIKRGPVDENSDRSLHNRTLMLGGLSWSYSEYRKTMLLTTYGNTDDVDFGYLVSLAGGYEAGEFNNRWYVGGRLSGGGFGKMLGYRAWLVEGGGFFRGSDVQDGAVRLNVNGFSKLSPPGRYRYRFFYGLDYLAGFDRQSNDRLKLRVEGVDTNLEDIQRITLGLEPVLFTPWRVVGFRFSVFGSMNLGNVGPDPDSFLRGKYYSSFGVGMRFHSDQVIFGAYEVRLVYVPDVPAGASATVFGFSTVREVSGGNFAPGPPDVVRYN